MADNSENETSDQKEIWHWDTWIRYLPVVNILYGIVRTCVYGGKAAGQLNGVPTFRSVEERVEDEQLQILPDNSTNIQYSKETTRSLFTVVGGILGILASYYTAILLCGVIQNPVTAWLMKLIAEMTTGQLVQNAFIVSGDVMTCWTEWKLKSKDEWEELVNTEMIKIPFVGCLYSVMRPFTCNLIGKVDLEVKRVSLVNALINIFASNVGLGAGYGFHMLAHHPGIARFCHELWDKCQWADEFGRLFFAQNGWLEKLTLSLFPAVGKGLGSGTQYGLNSLAQQL